jgi:hypothetical protein
MQRKMLLGIKERAERARHARGDDIPAPPPLEVLHFGTPVPSTPGRLTLDAAPEPTDTEREMSNAHSTG